jgi:UMF1 family MFS transporter
MTGRRYVGWWVLYDFVNSLFVINGSLYYSQWLVTKQGVSEGIYGLAYVVATIGLLIVAPALGVHLDRRRRGLRLLFLSTLAMGGLGITLWALGSAASESARHLGTLVVFGAIVLIYQLSLIVYNWILRGARELGTRNEAKRLTGYGDASGSLGSVVGAIAGAVLYARLQGPNRELEVILVMGGIFLLLGLGVVWLMSRSVGEDAPLAGPRPGDVEGMAGRLEGAGWRLAVGVLRKNGALWRYLLVFMIYADALLTVQLYLPVFMRQGVRLPSGQVSVAFALALSMGALGALTYSRMSRRWQSPWVILVTLVLWTADLLWLAARPQALSFWACMVASGVLYGMLWAASRALMYEMLARAELGRGFGFYGIFERAASVIGPLLWAAAVGSGPGLRYGTALCTMAVLVGASALLFGLWFGRIRRSLQDGNLPVGRQELVDGQP